MRIMLRKFSLFLLVILLVFYFSYSSFGKSNSVYVDYHFLKGYLELYKGDFKDAAEDLWKVAPYVKSEEFYQELVDVLVYVGRYDQAQSVLERAIKVFPRSREFYYKLFDIYTIEKNKKAALNIMRLIQERFRQTPQSIKKIAIMYIKSGKYSEAYKKLKEYLKYKKNDASAYYLLSQVCFKLKDSKCAIENAKKAYNMRPTQYQYLIFLAGLYEKNGKYLDAIKLYDKLPKTALVYFVIANDYYMAGKLDKAAEFYRKAFEGSHRIDYLERLAYVLVRNKEFKEVINLKNTYPKFFDESDRLKLLYGIALSEVGECNEALSEFSKINPTVDFYTDVVVNESQCLCKMGKLEKIEGLLDQYGKLVSYFYVISQFCIKNKKYDEAVRLFEDALKKAKDNKEKAKVYFYEADFYYSDLKNRDRAIDLLKESIKLNPYYAEALNYLGYLYIDEDINVKEGMELVERALSIKKNNPYYLDSLGWGYFRLKQYKKAEFYLKKAIKYYKNNKKAIVVSYEHLLEVYKAMGKIGEARQVALKILKLDPNNKKAKDFLNRR